ncbi:MAG: hypothetical protein AB2L20_28975 [Mangrovibacterium sp.]
MTNLLRRYRRLFEKPGLWHYYTENKEEISCEFPFIHDYMNPESFIKDYFRKGEKGEIFHDIPVLEKERVFHTISVFFLGAILANKIPYKEFRVLEPDFKYLWFLACLFHDWGYTIEKNKKDYPPQNTLLNWFEESDPRYRLFDNWRPTVIPPVFMLSIIEKYFDFCRLGDDAFINHGYVGALKLYAALRKNYERIKVKANTTDECFEYQNLVWKSSDEEHYRHVSEVILAHNIWFCTEEKNKKKYEDNNLDELIIIGEGDKRIKRRKYPLLFLLALADTIEPIKAFPNIQPCCLLEKIDISVGRGVVLIKVLDNCLNFSSWFEKIEDMQKWLDVEVKCPGNGTCEITINK